MRGARGVSADGLTRLSGVRWVSPGDACITRLKAKGPSRICNESKEEEKKVARIASSSQGVASNQGSGGCPSKKIGDRVSSKNIGGRVSSQQIGAQVSLLAALFAGCEGVCSCMVQGYLAYKKRQPPLGPP